MYVDLFVISILWSYVIELIMRRERSLIKVLIMPFIIGCIIAFIFIIIHKIWLLFP